MSDQILDAAELEAIQSAIRETTPRGRSEAPDAEAVRVPLIRGDRDADAARPQVVDLMNRWLRSLERTLRVHIPGELQLAVISADVVDGKALRDELRAGWIATLRTSNGALVAVAVRGRAVEIAAARRCGDDAIANDSGRTPTALAVRLFEPVGASVANSLATALKEVAGTTTRTSELAIDELTGTGACVRASITIAGDSPGQIVVYLVPTAVLPPPSTVAAVAVDRAAIGRALAGVAVDISVELGRIDLSLARLRKLRVGDILALSTFVDSAVPLRCGNVIKAYGKPIVSRGVLAVEIRSVVGVRHGGKS